MTNKDQAVSLHLDCASGLAGDMFLGACVDAGMPEDVLLQVPEQLGLPDVTVAIRREVRGGLSGTKVDVLQGGVPIESIHNQGEERRLLHTHANDGGCEESGKHDSHRGLTQILQLIGQSELDNSIKQRSEQLFRRLGEVEAGIHGLSLDRVHFHELGAVDSMVDIVGAAAAIEYFKPDRVTCSTVVVGNGTVSTDHGLLPVPAPATAELLRGLPVSATGHSSSAALNSLRLGELVTPTGALLLDHLVDRSKPHGCAGPMITTALGWGLGSKELADRPNACRLSVALSPLDTADATGFRSDTICVLEATLDDASGERVAATISAALRRGAKDAYAIATMMKKGRPGFHVTVLCDTATRLEQARSLLIESGSLGCRVGFSERYVAHRRVVMAETRWGSIAVKVGTLAASGDVADLDYVVAPESDSCHAVAKANGLTWAEVYAEAQAQALVALTPSRRMHHTKGQKDNED